MGRQQSDKSEREVVVNVKVLNIGRITKAFTTKSCKVHVKAMGCQ
jgi:zona occludens toxin (predicted ATPase)